MAPAVRILTSAACAAVAQANANVKAMIARCMVRSSFPRNLAERLGGGIAMTTRILPYVGPETRNGCVSAPMWRHVTSLLILNLLQRNIDQ
jgi:hypothetical protein